MPLHNTDTLIHTVGITSPFSLGCPVCGAPDLDVFFQVSDVPAHVGLQWDTAQAAQTCTRGDIELAICPDCGFISNVAFDEDRLDYTQAYDNSLHFSTVFQTYARKLASQLVNRYNLVDKDIIEIGCGRGDFLEMLCKPGNNRGTGFDPSYPKTETLGNVQVINDYYSEQYAGFPADLICCRFVLEHIADPVSFLHTVRNAIKTGTIAYFEVPNALSILRDFAIWDIIYEHCSYFTPQSLAHTFARCGFRVLDVNETYNDQYIGIEAVACDSTETDPRTEHHCASDYTASFVEHWQGKLKTWQELLEKINRMKQRAVLWGAGAKSVSFLNILNVQDTIEYAIDLNPRKQGKYMAGTGQQIVAPEFLSTYKPDVVLIANPIYEKEIRKKAFELNLYPRFLKI